MTTLARPSRSKAHKAENSSAQQEITTIEQAALPRYRTPRTFVLLAHLYVLTKSGDRQIWGCVEKSATLTDLLMRASSMVMGADFRRQALKHMSEAVEFGLVTMERDGEGVPNRYTLTEDGIHFLQCGLKRRRSMRNRYKHLQAEHICISCAEDELNDWHDCMKEVRTRYKFSGDVKPMDFAEQIIRGMRERVQAVQIGPLWAGLVVR